MRTIGQRHGALCRFIQQYTQTHGWPPTRREMGAALGCTTTSLVAYYLEALEQQGYVSCQPAISRGLVLTPAGQALAEHAPAAGPGKQRFRSTTAGRTPERGATREHSRHQERQGVPSAFERKEKRS